MMYGINFYFKTGTQNFYRTRYILISEFGLVAPQSPSGEAENETLVWDDELGIGRYRVHFFPADVQPGTERDYEYIQFRYWLTKKRMKREIFERDPMKESIQRVRTTLEEVFLERPIGENWTIDEVLKSNDE